MRNGFPPAPLSDVLPQLDAHHSDGVRAVPAAGGPQRQDHISDTQGREADSLANGERVKEPAKSSGNTFSLLAF